MIVLAAVVLTACGGQAHTCRRSKRHRRATQAAPAASAPVVLHEGWTANPDTLNPAYAFLTQSYTIFDLIYGTLTTEGAGWEIHRRAGQGLVGGL